MSLCIALNIAAVVKMVMTKSDNYQSYVLNLGGCALRLLGLV